VQKTKTGDDILKTTFSVPGYGLNPILSLVHMEALAVGAKGCIVIHCITFATEPKHCTV